jgi:hypothetical protein
MKFQYLLIQKFTCLNALIILIILESCHKSPGAICNDGHRSYSTGRGTCSWHGGVNHYIDTEEISVPKTIGLIILLSAGSALFISNNKNK